MGNRLLCLCVILLAVASEPLRVRGGSFTYQGDLANNGQAANGNYDLQFSLTSTPLEGGYVGPTLSIAPVPVENGAFTVLLDFGNDVFDGSARWLEIGVRTNGSASAYTLLAPRQPITAAPYALFAVSAGSGIAVGGTNPVVYGGLSLAGPTNIVLYATNNYVVTTSANTNAIMVSGAGSAAANGTYTLQSASPYLVFANSSGMNLVYLPDELDYVWQITDSANTVLYGSWADDVTTATGWTAVNGTAPAPSAIAYDAELVTNSVTRLGVAGAAVPGPCLGDELYVNAVIGNDLFAQRGRPDLPYATVYAAVQAAGPNDVVRVAPGVYNETPFRLTLPPGLRLIGAGKRVTCIYGHPAATGQADLDLSSGDVLSSFSTDFLMSLGGYSLCYPAYGGATNTLIEGIEATGVGDVVYGSWWQGFRAVDCDFTSQSDCFADAQLDDSGTNAVAEFYNCRMLAGWHGIANFGRGQLRVFGGAIQLSPLAAGACVLGWDSRRPGASIELSGVSLRYSAAGSGGKSYAIANESSGNCVVTIKGMLVNPASVYGAVNFEGFGLTTNVPFMRPGAGSGLLCFTNGILMDVK